MAATEYIPTWRYVSLPMSRGWINRPPTGMKLASEEYLMG